MPDEFRPRLASKLVRDKIPGNRIVWGSELFTFLISKLAEESSEVARVKSNEELIEELGDVIQVCYSLAFLREISVEQLDAARQAKWQEKGGFLKGVVQDGMGMMVDA